MNMTMELDRRDLLKTQVEQFFNLNIVGILGIGYSLGTAFALGCSPSLFGRSDLETMTAMKYSAELFLWSAAMYGGGLGVIVTAQIIFTSPTVWQEFAKPHPAYFEVAVEVARFASLLPTMGGLLLAAEAGKVVNTKAGLVVQGGFAFLTIIGIMYYIVLAKLFIKVCLPGITRASVILIVWSLSGREDLSGKESNRRS